MKYIFLDIDGVLNYESMAERKYHANCHGILGIDKNKVRLLKKIVDATGAEIVLISSWKRSFDAFKRNGYKAISLDDYLDIEELESCGVFGKYLSNKLYDQKLRVHDTTTRYEENQWNRGSGILKYLKENPTEAYVILDDDNFRDYQDRPSIINHLVLTNYLVGLSDEDVEKAIKILQDC